MRRCPVSRGLLESHKICRRFHNKIALVNTSPAFFVMGAAKRVKIVAGAWSVTVMNWCAIASVNTSMHWPELPRYRGMSTVMTNNEEYIKGSKDLNVATIYTKAFLSHPLGHWKWAQHDTAQNSAMFSWGVNECDVCVTGMLLECLTEGVCEEGSPSH